MSSDALTGGPSARPTPVGAGERPPRRYEHVAVLMGGWSAEREVSLSSGHECAAALEAEGFRVTRLDVDRAIAATLAALRPDACFNALHGRWGEDGCVQGILEVLAIPYTHSGVLASSLAMDKERTKQVVRRMGVPVAEGRLLRPEEALARHGLEPPYVAKPVSEGSSVGVVIVEAGANRPPEAIGRIPVDREGRILLEPFVAGHELTCSVIGETVTEIIDIVAAEHLRFYDYEAKYAPGGSRHILPAAIPAPVRDAIRTHTLAAHRALGCRGVSRCDFRWDPATGTLAFLEINTQPGMTPTSLVPELAAHAGVDFGALVSWLVEDASCNR
jgi:D-alanine-D-alanine ligase